MTKPPNSIMLYIFKSFKNKVLSFAKLCANHEPEPPTPLRLTLTPKTMATTTTTTTTRRSRQLLLLLAATQRSRNVVNWQAAVRHCVCHMCVCVCVSMGVSVLVCGGYVCVLCLLAKNLHSARSWPKVHKKCPTIATHAHIYIYIYTHTHTHAHSHLHSS